MAARNGRPYLPALILMLISTVWVGTLTLRPRDGEPVAALFPLGAAPDQVLVAAAGASQSEVIAFGNWPSVILVRSAESDLPHRLRAAGAWLVVRAPLTGGCFR